MNGNISQALLEVANDQGAWIPDVVVHHDSQAACSLWFENDILFETDALASERALPISQNSQASGHRASFITNLEFQMSQHEETILQEIVSLRRWYVISNADELSQFLRQHRSLPSLLLEIKKPLAEAFGEDARLGLSLAMNGDDAPMVRVAVSWPGAIADANAALDRFDDNFWLANYDRSSGHILVSFDLV